MRSPWGYRDEVAAKKLSGTEKVRTKILLDSNVWRYFADERAGAELMRRAGKCGIDVLIAPSVVYEALRTKDVDLRQRLVSLMAMPKWKRLMPEAFSESMELLGEIRRLRPNWLRANPDIASFRRFRYDWTRRTGGFWERARTDTQAVAAVLNAWGDPLLEMAREEIREARDEAEFEARAERVPLNRWVAQLVEPMPGYLGDRVEAWRISALQSSKRALLTNGHPYFDWLGPEVEMSKVRLDTASRVRFWLYEVSAENMPRFWLSWAFGFLQHFYRMTDGTPADIQLGTYLPEADIFVSADKALIRIIDKLRPHAPCSIAEPRKVPGGRAGVEATLELLST